MTSLGNASNNTQSADLSHVPLRLAPGTVVHGKDHSYVIEAPIRPGASGVVYKAHLQDTPKAQGKREHTIFAIKFYLPIAVDVGALFRAGGHERIERLQRWHENELQCLRSLDHPGIVGVQDDGEFQITSGDQLSPPFGQITSVKFLVTKYIHGKELGEFLSNPKLTTARIVRILGQLCDAIGYLHNQKEYLHSDIRPENIIIENRTSQPIVIDFALFKNFNFKEVNSAEISRITADSTILASDVPIRDPSKVSGPRSTLKKYWFPRLDLTEIGTLLAAIEGKAKFLTAEDAAYLHLLAEELRHWDRLSGRDVSWVKEQIIKLDPSYSRYMGVEELRPASSSSRYLQIPNRQVVTSDLIRGIINTRSFRRLQSINQLALVHLIYPGAHHRRFQHCLRAYGYCGDFLVSLNNCAEFRFLFEPTLARQALVVSLLHDINHFPFLHTFQELQAGGFGALDLLDLFCDGKATEDRPSIYELYARSEVIANN